MSERKRLLNLLDGAEKLYYTGEACNHIEKICFFADVLLANGVIVPPCKVGDKVYRTVGMSTGVTKVIKRTLCPPYKGDVLINCKPTIKRFIRSVIVTKNNFFDICENFDKTVFLTKEEAEQALKGAEGK